MPVGVLTSSTEYFQYSLYLGVLRLFRSSRELPCRQVMFFNSGFWGIRFGSFVRMGLGLVRQQSVNI